MKYDIIKDFDSIDITKWTEFVKNHPLGNVFQTPEMYQIYKSVKYYEPVIVACFNELNEMQGLVVSVIQREFKGILGKLSSRSIIWGAPLIKDNNPEILILLLDAYDKIVKKKAVYTQIRNLWDTNNFKNEFEKNGYKYEDHLNIIIDLTKSEEILWKEVFPKRRNQVKNAVKQGVTIEIFDKENLLEQSYNILLDVYKRAKLPFPEINYFKSAGKILADKGYLKLFGAFFENKMIGVMYLLCFNSRIYEWYIGCYVDYARINPNDLIIWEAFKWAKRNNFEIYDFGGAGKPDKEYGVRDYKKKFGGEFVNYGRFQKIHNRLLMIISVIGFKFWQILKF